MLEGRDPRSGVESLAAHGVMILGMHRSGTSCLAGLLETAGLFLGRVVRRARHNPKGNRENPEVRRLNDSLLEAAGGSWSDPPESLDGVRLDRETVQRVLAPYAGYDSWGLKDPRFLLTHSLWRPYLASARMVATFRHPLQVAGSLAERNGFSEGHSLELWAAYNEALVRLHRRHPFPLVRFDQPADDYLNVVSNIGAFLGLTYRDGPARAFFEPELAVRRPTPGPVPLGPWRSLFDYLEARQVTG